jgi:hypothetical protein
MESPEEEFCSSRNNFCHAEVRQEMGSKPEIRSKGPAIIRRDFTTYFYKGLLPGRLA